MPRSRKALAAILCQQNLVQQTPTYFNKQPRFLVGARAVIGYIDRE